MGERRQDVLVKQIEAPYVGIGVGKRWNRSFMKAAAESTDGYFQQINPDQPIAWLAFELVAILRSPRLLNVDVADNSEDRRYLLFAESFSDGEEICAVTRIGRGEEMPKSIVISGLLDGKPFTRELPVKDARSKADYLPRMWARLEIGRLLAGDALKHREKIVKLSKAMYVMSPFTSLLVLESEAQYEQFKVDRGRKDHWAIYPAPAKIPVVYEPLAGASKVKPGEKLPAKEVAKTIIFARKKPTSIEQGVQSFQNVADKYYSPLRDGGTIAAHNANLRTLRGEWRRFWLNGSKSHVLYSSDGASDSARFQLAQLRLSPVPVTNLNHPLRFDGSGFGGWAGSFGVPLLSRIPHLERLFAERVDAGFGTRRQALPVIEGFATPYASKESGYFLENVPSYIPMGASTARFDPLWLQDVNSVEFYPPALALPVKVNRATQLERSTFLRPSVTISAPNFYKLVAYAPGMRASVADMQAVLEAEARESIRIKTGRIAPHARKLFDKARQHGWHSWSITNKKIGRTFSIHFDGKGRYHYERDLPIGIRESVTCDGKTLTHLYPQLFIGAKRSVSRFHRSDLAGLVPWFLPPIEDFARGADVKLIAKNTVAIIPHRAVRAKSDKKKDESPSLQVHLVFDDGRLVERRLVEMPKNKTLYRLTCSSAGVIRLLDGKGKELASIKGNLQQD